MLVPEGIAEFLAMRPIWLHAGTRGADLAPAVHFANAFRVDPERRFVDVLVVDTKGSRLREHLADNGVFTANFVQLPSHKSYQLKGRGEILGASDPSVRALAKALADENASPAIALGFPQSFVDKMDALSGAPSTVVRLHPEHVFDQTPGPGAGKRMEG